MKGFFDGVHEAFTRKQSVSSEDVKTINQYKFLLSDTDSVRYLDLVRASMQTLAADAKDGGSGIICVAIMADAPAPSEPRMCVQELLEITEPDAASSSSSSSSADRREQLSRVAAAFLKKI